MDHGETQSLALAQLLGGKKWFGGSPERRLIHTAARVCYSDTDVLTCVKTPDAAGLHIFEADGNLEAPSVRHRIACVQRDIQKREFKLVGVRADWRKAALEFHGNFDCGSERTSQHIGHASDEVGDIHGLPLEFRALREGKQPLGEGSAPIDGVDGASKPRLNIDVIGQAPRENFEVSRNDQQQIIEIMRDAAGELAHAFELLHLLHLGPRRFALAGPFFDAAFQFGGPLFDAALQLRIEELELPGLPEEVGKYPYLGQQKFGDDWHKYIIDRPVAVPFHTIWVGQRDGGNKDDCGVLKARMIADHPSEFKTGELRHADIAQNDSDVLLEKLLERLLGGPGFDQVFSEALQYRLVAEELRRLIVDKQNVNRVLDHDTPRLPVKP